MQAVNRALPFVLFLLAFSLFAAAPAAAQKAKVGKEYFEDHHFGYKFRYPEEWLIVPVKPEERKRGMIAQMGGPSVTVRVGGNQAGQVTLKLDIWKFDQEAAVTRDEDEGSGGLRGRVERTSSRPTIADKMGELARGYGFRDFEAGEIDDFKASKIGGLRQEFTAFTGDYDATFVTFTFALDDFDIALVFWVPDGELNKWGKVAVDAAKTFRLIDRVEALELTEDATYDQKVAYYRDQASRTVGWEVVETPSQRYIVLTSSKDADFVKTIIDRLENSRDLFESEFPPSKPISHVSLVRICSTMEEFHKYGKTGGGVAGWFNPSTTELVIVDFKDYNRKMTYGVMTHEGFHQYCHFLFDQSEAHRWFDEGHGDYYGAFEFKGKKAITKAKMAGGIERLTGIKQMIREGTYRPIAEHVRLDHGQWQSQGPSNVSCYEQSWSIIYMLREGMKGNVPRKLWRDEYGEIVPVYMRTLHEGYLKAYDELRDEVRKSHEASGEELDPKELESSALSNRLSQERKQEIWDAAINASWGQVDMDEFEAHWREFVENHLRN
ncbi:MAG TPA: hypothetical protein VGC54_11805 [Planctomycetota bacterium]